jgi:hypothetical protein
MASQMRTKDQEMADLKRLISDFQEQGWEKAWYDPGDSNCILLTLCRETSTLPWEYLRAAQPPLQTLLQSDQQDWPRHGRALVPGCGRVGRTQELL